MSLVDLYLVLARRTRDGGLRQQYLQRAADHIWLSRTDTLEWWGWYYLAKEEVVDLAMMRSDPGIGPPPDGWIDVSCDYPFQLRALSKEGAVAAISSGGEMNCRSATDLSRLPLPEQTARYLLAAYDLEQVPRHATDEELTDLQRTRGANIAATARHDAGAYARCSYCGRYTANPCALSGSPRVACDCGKPGGWCGSFKPPGPCATWSIGLDREP